MNVLRPICHYCSQHRLESEVIKIPLSGGCYLVTCFYCEEARRKAQDAFAQNPRFHCDECGEGLHFNKNSPARNIRAYWEPKDGTWALMCEGCSKPYEQKRRDLFRDTPYGYRTGITK